MNMNAKVLIPSVVLFGCLGLLSGMATAQTGNVPAALKGQIVTSSKEIEIPTAQGSFVQKIRKQDKDSIKKVDDKWVINFVAFFNRPLPGEQIGVVVLDGKGEPVAVAEVGGTKGQTSLSSQIVVDSTETPKQKHTVQVYFPQGKKPIVLAKKQITLK
jgi:hypothetical protein